MSFSRIDGKVADIAHQSASSDAVTITTGHSWKWFQAKSEAGRLPWGGPALRVLAKLDDIKQEEAAPEQISTPRRSKARNRQQRDVVRRKPAAHL
jgi:hypothetical protein